MLLGIKSRGVQRESVWFMSELKDLLWVMHEANDKELQQVNL